MTHRVLRGMPLAVLEAMAAGRPVITSRIGALESIITPEHDGVPVPPADAQALAAVNRPLGPVPSLRRCT